MKHSIKKIFKNLITFLIFSSFLSFLALALVIEQTFSFEKIENLKGQKEILLSLKNLPKKDVDLAIIQFNGKSKQISLEIEKLRKLYEYDFTSNYIFDTDKKYISSLNKMQEYTQKFNQSAVAYYKSEEEDEKQTYKLLVDNFILIDRFIDSIIMDDIYTNQEKTNLLYMLLLGIFTFVTFYTFWYKNRLSKINNDILHIYSVESNKKEYNPYTLEIDAIMLKMKKKPAVTDNPAMIDTLTEINNLKGLLASYTEKKVIKDGSFTAVTILEVDNFSKIKRPFPQDIAQMILKKIAFTITLHEQPTDVIGRTDYNQFTIVMTRSSKEKALKDIELIRQSISELKIKVPNVGAVVITMSGGFIIKPNNISLEESMKQSKELLAYAHSTGESMLAQSKDLAEHDLQPAHKK